MQYIFGAYTLDVQRDELRAAAGVVQLDRQVFAVLAYLVQHRDRSDYPLSSPDSSHFRNILGVVARLVV